MAITFICPICKTSYTVNDAETGKKIDCKSCGQRLQVPPPPRSRTILGEVIADPQPLSPPPSDPLPSSPQPVAPEPPPLKRKRASDDDDAYRQRGSRGPMYNNEESIRIRTSLSGRELEDVIRDEVGRLGHVSFSSRGQFDVSGSKHRNFATDIKLAGELSKGRQEDEWTVRLSYSIQPTGACWAIGIVGFFLLLIGPLVFLFPLLAKNEVQRSVSQVLRDVRNEAESRGDHDR